MRFFALILAVSLLTACSPESPAPTRQLDPAHDYFSFANTTQFITDHLRLDLTVDFEHQVLHGVAQLDMRRLDPAASEIILDTRDLNIERILVGTVSGETSEAVFSYSRGHPRLGQALHIDLPKTLTQADITVSLHYQTGPGATALQWIPAELSAGGEKPLMFSQSQSIHARSWVPLQDTPSVRFTYDALIHTPQDLLAVMSADNDPLSPRSGEYRFAMPQPIPSYLLAIAVGNFYFAPIGERTGIYAEPELLDASVVEFSTTQQMLEAAEALYGPYRWGRYDLLILPPSFPFGGMENPRLSFITPSVLAGDRSLVSLIAHELAHSWSGNLVSNRTWRDIWLNEGVTSYLDSRLMEVLFGRERAGEERVLSYRGLLSALETVSPAKQALAPIENIDDPGDSQGGLAYQKGELFFRHLENIFGRTAFDDFLAAYFDHFAFQAISSEQFLDYLEQNLLLEYPGKFDREQASQWLYQPGLPNDAPIPVSTTLQAAERLALDWAAGETSLTDIPVSSWSPYATVHFINSLPVDLTGAQLQALDTRFLFSQTRNAEIAQVWFTQVAARRHQPAYAAMRNHLERYGRIKLIQPVYLALVDNGQDAALAREIFDAAKVRYHPLASMAIERSLKRADR